jgi:hypothetical protein
MIYSADLLAIAQDIARRIPNDEAYAPERNTSWLAIGKAHLALNDFEAAAEALNFLTERPAQAELRFAAGQPSVRPPPSMKG